MDALSVVLQLKRIAADNNPSPDILSKMPRLAVGLSYFLEHPDMSVQHEAAKALLLTCDFHLALIGNSIEVKELRKNASQHCSSSDEFLKSVCKKIIDIISLHKYKVTDLGKQELDEAVKTGVEYQKINEFESKSCDIKKIKTNEVVEGENNSSPKTNLQTDNNLVKLKYSSSVSDVGTTSTVPFQDMHSPYEQLDDNGTNKGNLKISNTCSDYGDSTAASLASGHHYSSPTASSSSFANCTSFNLSKQKESAARSAVEGELHTIVLGLKKFVDEDEVGWKSTESFTQNLQEKIICMPGVISATVNVKKKTNSIAKNDNEKYGSECRSDISNSAKESPYSVAKDSPSTEPKTGGEEDSEKTWGKIEVIAIVVIKLPFDRIKRKNILQKLRENYYILKIQSMSNRESVSYVSSSFCFSEKKAQNCVVETKKNSEIGIKKRSGNMQNEEREIGESNHEEYENVDHNEGNMQQEKWRESEDIDESGLKEDELDSDALGLDIKDNNGILAYLDEDEHEENVEKMKLKMKNETDFNQQETWHKSASGWSFFNRNSVLFGESRHLSRSAIVPSDDDPNLIIRLRKEKERRAAEKLQQQRTQNTLDRVLQGISSIKFW